MPIVAIYVSSDDGLGNEDHLQPKAEMASSGHLGSSCMTWTMLTTWPFFRTLDIRCRKRPALLQTPQHVWALTSIGGTEADVRARSGKARAALQ